MQTAYRKRRKAIMSYDGWTKMKTNLPILLVDDDRIDVMTVKRAFVKNNITNKLHVASNGEEALKMLRGACESPPVRPGLILLDLNMPLMNGIEFLEIAKNDVSLRRIPVVVLTTSIEGVDKERCFDLGVAGYFVKPVVFESFVEAIKAIDRYWTISEIS